MSKRIDGKAFVRALSYAEKACPTDDAGARMQQVAFIGDRILCSDGERWHVGWLPPGTVEVYLGILGDFLKIRCVGGLNVPSDPVAQLDRAGAF